MKIDRLLGIINILSQTDIITAPELARRFEVSRRTINRDIEDICKAGIPIVTKQGAGGGIYIQEGYKIDKSLLKSRELSNIIIALKGLGSVSRNGDIKALLKKIAISGEQDDIITIDLASYYKGSLSFKIDKLKEAIVNRKIVEFTYYGKNGEHERRIEPYQITYKWSDWYMFGYCLYKNDFRMFKLNRMWDLNTKDDNFSIRQIPEEKMQFGSHLTDENEFEAIFDSTVKYLIVEMYGPNSFTCDSEGKLHFKGRYTNLDFIVSWLLGFGDMVEVTSPIKLVEEMKAQANLIAKKYNNHQEHDT
jgi:predicted DNA-binding transcriptional regulator YafY